MEDMARLKCVPCRGGEPRVTEKEIAEFSSQIPQWKVVERDGIKRLERSFNFKNFAEALSWTDEVRRIGRSRRSSSGATDRVGQGHRYLVDA